MIGPQDESVESNRKIICTSSDIRNIRGDHSIRIETIGVNKYIWSPRSDMTSNVLSRTDNVNKFVNRREHVIKYVIVLGKDNWNGNKR